MTNQTDTTSQASANPAASQRGQGKVESSKAYRVHLYAVVRVPVDVPNAASQLDAIQMAKEMTDLNTAFKSGEYADEISSVLVDEVGDRESANSTSYVADCAGSWKPDAEETVPQPSFAALIAESLPSTEGYEKAFKDALESMCLALANKLSPEDLNEAITTALDAYANNAEDARDDVTPGM